MTKGLLPAILDELLTARKQAKRDMAAATDPMEKAVQNGRQLALKVACTSVFCTELPIFVFMRLARLSCEETGVRQQAGQFRLGEPGAGIFLCSYD